MLFVIHSFLFLAFGHFLNPYKVLDFNATLKDIVILRHKELGGFMEIDMGVLEEHATFIWISSSIDHG